MNPEQLAALRAVEDGCNVFITGSAGTGKSFLIHAIRDYAAEANKSIMITALTGVAASLLGGRTIHSALMLGLGKKTPEEMLQGIRMRGKSGPLGKWRALHMLVIDEISMMSAELFEKISALLSLLRRNPAPFGGIQLILSGDFAQLPPVEGVFCFKSPHWTEAVHKTAILTQLMRQATDPVFQAILEKARRGKCPRSTWDALVARMGQPLPEGIVPTVLFATRKDADHVNASSYAELKASGAKEMVYSTAYGGRRVETTRNWAKNVDIPETTALCIGAQVMLTANLDVEGGLVNGTRGIVTRLMRDSVEIQLVDGSKTLIPGKKHTDDTETMHATYIPLKLAWAWTVHKSQGTSLDCAAVDLGPSMFAYGQAYTALSRVRDMGSLHIMDLAKASFKVDPDVKAFYGW